MNDRIYRLILGTLLLVFLYFDLHDLMLALIAVLFIEGITNLRVPRLVAALRSRMGYYGEPVTYVALAPRSRAPRFTFESERAWRLLVGALLFVSYVLDGQQLWFLPWFMGLAIFGAGVSGVCPGLFSLKLMGLK